MALGRGSVDFPALFGALEEHGYRGYVTIERTSPDDPVRTALLVIMEKRLGLTTVADADGRLVGVLTDGDLKRILLARGTDGFFETKVADVMHTGPRTIEPTSLVAGAVRRMEDNEPAPITALVVVDGESRPIGVLHLHDCLRLGVR